MTALYLGGIDIHHGEHTLFTACTGRGPRRPYKQPCEGSTPPSTTGRDQLLHAAKLLGCLFTVHKDTSTIMITSHYIDTRAPVVKIRLFMMI